MSCVVISGNVNLKCSIALCLKVIVVRNDNECDSLFVVGVCVNGGVSLYVRRIRFKLWLGSFRKPEFNNDILLAPKAGRRLRKSHSNNDSRKSRSFI